MSTSNTLLISGVLGHHDSAKRVEVNSLLCNLRLNYLHGVACGFGTAPMEDE